MKYISVPSEIKLSLTLSLFSNSFFTIYNLKQELNEAQEEYQKLIRDIHGLEHKVFATKKVVREKFNFCREGEQILIYK